MISSLHASVLASTYQYNCIEPSKNRWTHIIYATYIGLWQWVCVCVRACDVIKLIGIGESIPKKIKQIEVYIDILKFNSLPLRVPFHSDNNKIYTERQLNFIIYYQPKMTTIITVIIATAASQQSITVPLEIHWWRHFVSLSQQMLNATDKRGWKIKQKCVLPPPSLARVSSFGLFDLEWEWERVRKRKCARKVITHDN